jgi:hypothetical protein
VEKVNRKDRKQNQTPNDKTITYLPAAESSVVRRRCGAGHTQHRHLYDLQTDPWELNNIVGKPEHAEVLTRLRTQLDAWMQQQGDEGDKAEREAKEHQGARVGKKTKNK